MPIVLLTKSCSLNELRSEQASSRGVLRMVTDKTLETDYPLVKAGIRLFCEDMTDTKPLDDLRRAIPTVLAYTRSGYLRDHKKFLGSLGLDSFQLRSELLDLLRVVLCEIHESGHPVYLIVDDEKIPGMIALKKHMNDLFEHVCQRLKMELDGTAAVMLVPASACGVQRHRQQAAV